MPAGQSKQKSPFMGLYLPRAQRGVGAGVAEAALLLLGTKNCDGSSPAAPPGEPASAGSIRARASAAMPHTRSRQRAYFRLVILSFRLSLSYGESFRRALGEL